MIMWLVFNYIRLLSAEKLKKCFILFCAAKMEVRWILLNRDSHNMETMRWDHILPRFLYHHYHSAFLAHYDQEEEKPHPTSQTYSSMLNTIKSLLCPAHTQRFLVHCHIWIRPFHFRRKECRKEIRNSKPKKLKPLKRKWKEA